MSINKSPSPGSTTNAGAPDVSTTIKQSRFQPRRFLTSNIDQGQTLLQLSLYCFLTGFTSAPTFLACYLWCGFQTGGLVQLSLAVARLFASSPRDTTFHKADQQALTSLLSFLLGSSIGRIGDRVGPKRRWWIMTATFIMALFAMAAALCAHSAHEPSVAEFRLAASWQNAKGMAALGFASASLAQFGTAVVLTTIWVELVNDPKLFALKLAKSRDHRIIGVFSVFLGGMCSAAIVFASNSATALGVAAGLRIISMLSWLLVPMEAQL
ncbi:SPOSA6832_00891 [Sporobolomyces salmonicolor]|uniref:SPOSA6832_00891-mRNA-1:cds n=1 Tax=Sporidiobolus salmonicolor TaxID=5005 RepID=A0A0D6EHI0_SPOSA|nr:SPOSA6832_00891 [Sporobolomyces salmonicolor]